ncbi:MAG: hypothetical protein KY462_09370 [Actinobacteria bacterium]|nr:hypothetical protein [Actinomycetota bacterium]
MTDGQADPLQADPLQADPLQADPLQADPLQTDPLQADPLQADPLDVARAHLDAVATRSPAERSDLYAAVNDVLVAELAAMDDAQVARSTRANGNDAT